ncbi:peroxisomal membrane protein PEX13 [Tribolium castaneum]|uniref:Peroxisomal membrane protein PEX13 n=1 Tax=Tribolium castaneum TaxID=7070 RepID=D6WSW5_TRICA|nr:PREDICTED: peroxisomal membrane protein PEX13 [Tribolium castaneum]EFA06668.1 Peroxisomal membrane protein PEX13-like Protein [Tribolium castaneum]|eukprot:XP_975792.1 PREDICTED: peroxisomal membrane protein PEX13 [Tribolium castaneum]
MTSPLKPWESNSLQNASQIRSSHNLRDVPMAGRSAPVLPPLPRTSPMVASSAYSSYMPYSSGYSSLGYGMPYRSSLYNSYGSYGGYNSYNMYGMGGYPSFGVNDDAERRFIQYAEESSRNTFASVESIVRAVNSISMMLDNTFFAMTSSFRAVLSVADNFGRLRSMFGHIWYSINIFRLFNWLYRKFMWLIGRKVPNSATSLAWRQASGAPPTGPAPGSSWPTLAFLGVLVSAPYIISKFLPKYEDKCDPANWKSPGVRAKAAFDFVARSQNEMSVQTNDELTLAPTYVQEEMNLRNTGWAFAVANGRSGVVPLNYLVISKAGPREGTEEVPVPRVFNKTHTKRVSFGENQVFENVDLDDYVTGKKEIKGVDDIKNSVKEGVDDNKYSLKEVSDSKKDEQQNKGENEITNQVETKKVESN